MVNERIKRLRLDKGLTIRELSSVIGIPFNTYAGYEYYRNRKIPLSTLEKLSEFYGTTIEYLKNGYARKEEKSVPAVIYVDVNTNTERISYVPIAAQAGYLKNYTDLGYLSQLDTYNIPGFSNGTYRMFPVNGDSMLPTYYTGAILICQPVEHYNLMQDGNCYVIISNEGICVKRCINAVDKRRVIIIESDNIEYKPDIITIESVIEIWSPKARITYN